MNTTASTVTDSKRTPQVHVGGRIGIDYGRGQTDKNKRTHLGRAGCNIYRWPSTGGVIIRPQADAIEMQYVGLDRLNSPEKRFRDQEDEDVFCLRLLNIGEKWWPSEQRATPIWRELNYMTTEMEDEVDEKMLLNRFGLVYYEDPEEYAGFANRSTLVFRRGASDAST